MFNSHRRIETHFIRITVKFYNQNTYLEQTTENSVFAFLPCSFYSACFSVSFFSFFSFITRSFSFSNYRSLTYDYLSFSFCHSFHLSLSAPLPFPHLFSLFVFHFSSSFLLLLISCPILFFSPFLILSSIHSFSLCVSSISYPPITLSIIIHNS